MKKHNPILLKEAWALCFLLGLVMLNYPFLHIFNKETTILGIPLLLLYFFLGWPASILIVFFFSRHLEVDDDNDRENHL